MCRKSLPLGPATRPVGHDAAASDLTKLGKLTTQPLLVNIPAEVADEQVGGSVGGDVGLALLGNRLLLVLGLALLGGRSRFLRLLGLLRVGVRVGRFVVRVLVRRLWLVSTDLVFWWTKLTSSFFASFFDSFLAAGFSSSDSLSLSLSLSEESAFLAAGFSSSEESLSLELSSEDSAFLAGVALAFFAAGFSSSDSLELSLSSEDSEAPALAGAASSLSLDESDSEEESSFLAAPLVLGAAFLVSTSEADDSESDSLSLLAELSLSISSSLSDSGSGVGSFLLFFDFLSLEALEATSFAVSLAFDLGVWDFLVTRPSLTAERALLLTGVSAFLEAAALLGLVVLSLPIVKGYCLKRSN